MGVIDFKHNDFSSIFEDSFAELADLYGEDLAEAELQLEHEAYLEGEARFRKTLQNQIDLGDFANTTVSRPLISTLVYKFKEEFNEWIKKNKEGKGKKQVAYLLINSISPEVAAVITLKIVLGCLTQEGNCLLQRVASKVGRALEDELRYSRIREEETKYFYSVVKPGLNKRVGLHYKKAYAQVLESSLLANDKLDDAWSRWSPQNCVHVGIRLLEILILSTGLIEVKRMYAGNKKKDGEFIQLTSEFVKDLSKRAGSLSGISPIYQPCVVPPKDWYKLKGGGYWAKGRRPTVFIRAGSKKALSRYTNVDLSAVYEAVNIAQRTPWRVNKTVLAVVNEMMNWKNIDMEDIPSAEPAPLPVQPSDIDTNPEALKRWKKEATFVYRKEKSRISKRLRLESIVAQANKFAKYSKIYFPMNLDWRGRVYAIPAFNPQGNDLTKGLLLFAERKPIGADGFFWLKLHGANTAGVDKVGFEARLKFIDDNHDKIIAVAADPLNNLWWTEQDSPFCFLAFCIEYAKVCEVGLEYECSLPISFDGSCSGIQHLSAMLRDEIGGKAVNLTPTETVQDLYQIVADGVTEVLNKDSLEGTDNKNSTVCNETTGEIREVTKLGTKTLAQQWLSYEVTRKVTKRSCMTLAYGSKQYGFKEQVLEDTILPTISSGDGLLAFSHPSQAASYLAELIWNVVKKVVVAAVKVMQWLQAIAGLLSAEVKDRKTGEIVQHRTPIHWVTPDGFHVWQEYCVQSQIRLNLIFLGEFRLQPTINTHNDKQIDARKQKIAFPPNYTHSMDGAHLRETVRLAYNQYDITSFALIHDSFGTLPADAGKLFKAIREAFVTMYKEHDVLLELSKHVEPMLHESQLKKFPELPEKGNLNIEDVLDSKFAFA